MQCQNNGAEQLYLEAQIEGFRFMSKDILILNTKKISAKQKFILSAIDTHSKERGYCSLSNSELAELIGEKYPKNINRDLKKLVSEGLLQISGTKKRKLTPTIPAAIKGFNLVIPNGILNLKISFEAKIIFALLAFKSKQEEAGRKFTIKTLAKYAGISEQSFYDTRKRHLKLLESLDQIANSNVSNCTAHNIDINIDNKKDFKYINIFEYILTGLASISKYITTSGNFEAGDDNLLSNLENNLDNLQNLLNQIKNAAPNQSTNSLYQNINSPVSQGENMTEKIRRTSPAPAQNNVQEKIKKEKPTYYCRELEEEIFNKYPCFTRHKNTTKIYKKCADLIHALKNGMLKSHINLPKAYERQILAYPKKFSYNRPINMSQFEDMMTKKYSLQERREIYAQLANLFDAQYEPKEKGCLDTRRSLYNLCINTGKIKTSWLVQILLFGNEYIKVYKSLDECIRNEGERSLVNTLRRTFCPNIITNLDLQRDYLDVIRKTHDYYSKTLKKELEGNTYSDLYYKDFYAFMGDFINYHYSVTTEVHKVKPTWFLPNSFSLRNFVNSIVKKDVSSDAIEYEDLDPNDPDIVKKYHYRNAGLPY